MIYLVLALWILYAIFEGWREAQYFHKIMDTDKSTGRLLHFCWNTQRAIVMAIIFIAYPSWWVIGLGLLFPFFHDGCYYQTRHILNPKNYKKGWFDHSSTSTAILSKFETNISRIIFAILGIAVIAADFII